MAKYARSVILDKNKEKQLKRLHVEKKSSLVKSRTNIKSIEHKSKRKIFEFIEKKIKSIFLVVKKTSTVEMKKNPSRPSNYFDNCIVIDDDATENNVDRQIVSIESDDSSDEVLEIERQR